MALPATHIRFAAAIADRLAVSDWRAYLSGTLYPDSRWLTGIDRRHTHDARFLDPDFVTDDFTLGWHIHCVCDHIQERIHRDLLPDRDASTADANWVQRSAAKVLQDRCDAAVANLAAFLPLLTDCRTPSQETPDLIAAYFSYVRHAYRHHTTPAWADYAELWARVGLKKALIVAIESAVERLLADDALERRIVAAFDRMLARWTRTHGSPSLSTPNGESTAKERFDR